MTPEGKIKKQIRHVLAIYSEYVYEFWPVPGGYGRSTIDCLGFVCGFGFAIEAKAPGEKPTERQEVIIKRITQAQVKVFIVDGPDGLAELDRWLSAVTKPYNRSLP